MELVEFKYNEYGDEAMRFSTTPDWLLEAIKNGNVIFEFRTEDYWYAVVPAAHDSAAPGDFIVRFDDGTLDVVPGPLLFIDKERINND